MSQQRISYVNPGVIGDPKMREELERCRREGTPRPESQAIRAHVPAVFWSFANAWRDVFHNGVLDHSIKELCRVYVSKSVKCEYCGKDRGSGFRERPSAFDRFRFSATSISRLGIARLSPWWDLRGVARPLCSVAWMG